MSSAQPQQRRRDPYFRTTILPIVLLLILFVAVLWFLRKVQEHVDERLASTLQTVLHTTDKALENWAEQTEIDVAVLAENESLVDAVEAQLVVPRDREDLLHSTALPRIRSVLAAAMRIYEFPGFVIIAPDGFQIAAQENEAIGLRRIADSSPDLLTAVMNGKTQVGLPVNSPLFVDPETHRPIPLMTVAAPIRDEEGNVIAALALRVDPRRDFTRAAQLGRLEQTGETYAFDRNGRMLTESRFTTQLQEAGLIGPGENSVLNLEIRDPGGNVVKGFRPKIPRHQQPFTKMVQIATSGQSGIDLAGYRDYRGIPVVGAWLWDDELNMGVATEMDVSEAFGPYRRVRELILIMLLLTAAITVAFLLILRHRERLLAANAAFEETVRAREDMMAIVSHDLKNPINTLVLRSHIMLQMLDAASDREVLRQNLKLQQRTANHINQLLGDLTDATKSQAGRLHVERHTHTVQETLEPPIERMRLLAQDKGIDLVVRIAAGDRRILADSGRIAQVLDNLLGNALKFTPPDGRIAIEAIPAGDKLQVSVADTGPGIPEEALPRIFEPYWQVRRTRTSMGLGLFIAKTLIEAHGGRIWVETSKDRGTTFYFTLPFSTA